METIRSLIKVDNRSFLAADGASLCVGAGAAGGGTTPEALPAVLLAAAFLGGAVWMFRRWSGKDVVVLPAGAGSEVKGRLEPRASGDAETASAPHGTFPTAATT